EFAAALDVGPQPRRRIPLVFGTRIDFLDFMVVQQVIESVFFETGPEQSRQSYDAMMLAKPLRDPFLETQPMCTIGVIGNPLYTRRFVSAERRIGVDVDRRDQDEFIAFDPVEDLDQAFDRVPIGDR